jgi:hypothetical protein
MLDVKLQRCHLQLPSIICLLSASHPCCCCWFFLCGYGCLLLAGLHVIEGGQTSTGSIVRWLSHSVVGDSGWPGYASLNEAAAAIAPGCEGLLCCDHFQVGKLPDTPEAHLLLHSALTGFAYCNKLQQSSSRHPAVIQQSSSSHPAVIQPSSSSHPAVIQPSSSHHPAVIQQSSSHHPAIIQQSSSSHPAVIQQSSSRHPAVIQQSSSSHPAIIQPSSSHHPAIIQQSSSSHPAIIQQSSRIATCRVLCFVCTFEALL